MTDVMNDEQPVELDAVPLEPAALREATNDELVAQLRAIVNTCGSGCFRRPPFRCVDRRLTVVSVG